MPINFVTNLRRIVAPIAATRDDLVEQFPVLLWTLFLDGKKAVMTKFVQLFSRRAIVQRQSLAECRAFVAFLLHFLS